MKLRLVAPARGARWVRNGFVAFLRYPLAFAGVFATCLFAMMVLSLLPYLGVVLLLVMLPVGSLLFMVATRLATLGTLPLPGAFLELARAPRAQRAELVKLGLAYAAGTACLMTLSGLIDGGALYALFSALPSAGSAPEATAAKLADPRLQLGLVVRLALSAVLAVPFWHAPALIHWGGLGWAKSLFFSTIACWRNKGAFAVYALVWFSVMVCILILVRIGAALLGQSGSALLAMPMTLILSTAFYATLYFTFADCFEMPVVDAVAPPAA